MEKSNQRRHFYNLNYRLQNIWMFLNAPERFHELLGGAAQLCANGFRFAICSPQPLELPANCQNVNPGQLES
jgi:hypothetical protein